MGQWKPTITTKGHHQIVFLGKHQLLSEMMYSFWWTDVKPPFFVLSIMKLDCQIIMKLDILGGPHVIWNVHEEKVWCGNARESGRQNRTDAPFVILLQLPSGNQTWRESFLYRWLVHLSKRSEFMGFPIATGPKWPKSSSWSTIIQPWRISFLWKSNPKKIEQVYGSYWDSDLSRCSIYLGVTINRYSKQETSVSGGKQPAAAVPRSQMSGLSRT